MGLAWSAFARHYSRNRCCFLLLRVLRCFTSPRSLHTPYVFGCGWPDMSPAGFPHSEILESQLGCQLLEAYRRLLRPSSAPGAKASTVCPYKLATHNKPTRHANTPAHNQHHPKDGTSHRRAHRRNYRCSRPLYSSQATTRHQPHTRHPPPHRQQYDQKTGPTETTPTPTCMEEACSLRTQQRAKPFRATRGGSDPPKRMY